MNPLPQNPVAASGSFAAMKSVPYRLQFTAYVLAMMADNIEHVISYWVVFQKFHSPALAGFAVLSHWLPFLLFSVAVGGLADRFDPRRIIQCGMLLFIVASSGWGFFFITDTIQMWHAMLLLVIHGCAGVLWQTPNQLLLYDLVGPADLPSAVRLNAMARYLGILVGPAVGGIIMLTLGTSHGIIFNTLFYLPMLLWLFWAPVRDNSVAVRRFAVRGLADIVLTIRAIGTQPTLTAMTWLAGLTSFMIGNAYHAQMPGYAGDLGHGDPGVSYSVLLAADAAGAVLAAIALESWGRLKGTPRTAIMLAMLWSAALLGFATVRIYPVAIVLLFCAGFFELSFNTMAQALVQVNAPHDIRGRVVGLYNMAGLGMRAFSGITVGLSGAAIGIHWSLGLSAAVLLALLVLLQRRAMRPA
ncbi:MULTISPECIES: MFS transporter [Bradyrhizobium]|uniref:MFS family permease n=1 Tax=Bradyrhizobium ottawaense TaxID=931866 RepID=A0ABV4G1J7_9BRAD|nr:MULTISPECIES: MFS transporter [Bradyrhizobium]WLB43514.1 MFS transporter [Bradyrhizobium ottawaense]BBO07239.1 MFS transporter [Bradyrhizobium ottawaense]GMO66515.1 MFS transporter [Bradyrhizobium ottawaense]GMO99635.1 MFS transporter [Bradyrhizobium ottawaense]GMP17186.1 MFS transporter [Bradyrhizobium ottawaense]